MPPQKALRSPKGKTLPPVHPNAALEAAYRAKLERLIERMNRSVLYWVSAAYRKNLPEMAQDESPAMALRRVMKQLAGYWEKQFDEGAKDLASYFATSAMSRADGALEAILRKSGFTVKFKLSPAANDVLQSTIGENIALIKSIPQQYLTQVEGMVMRSVQVGRDIGGLREEIQKQFGVTYRRASFIARDQNNKASATITRVRQVEMGITQAKWQHSAAGKHPRPSHLKAGKDGVVYDVREGWLDPDHGARIFPGELPNCRCLSRPIIPALSGKK